MTTRASSPPSALVDSGATLALANGNDKNRDSALQIHTNLIAARRLVKSETDDRPLLLVSPSIGRMGG